MEWGFQMKLKHILFVAKSYLEDRRGKSGNQHKFTNDLPRKDQIDLFLKRNPNLTLWFGENIKYIKRGRFIFGTLDTNNFQ